MNSYWISKKYFFERKLNLLLKKIRLNNFLLEHFHKLNIQTLMTNSSVCDIDIKN